MREREQAMKHRNKLTRSNATAPSGRRPHSKPQRRGQAVVETALMSLLLALLLAGAVDFGRAYYTTVVVTNMAGEGATYASINPDRDLNMPNPYPALSSCGQFAVQPDANIQDRARRVAQDRGLVIRQPSSSMISIQPANCMSRCAGQPITVTVTYQINDLFLPNLIGMNSITVRKSASQLIQRSAYAARQSGSCP